jgi:hypothetical protein
LNHKLPDIDIEMKSADDRIEFYRKYFADMRLNRLYFHIFLLKFFTGEINKNEIISLLQSNIEFLDKISIWTNHLKENGNFEEFKKICNEEIVTINSIIEIYENRMRKRQQ